MNRARKVASWIGGGVRNKAIGGDHFFASGQTVSILIRLHVCVVFAFRQLLLQRKLSLKWARCCNSRNDADRSFRECDRLRQIPRFRIAIYSDADHPRNRGPAAARAVPRRAPTKPAKHCLNPRPHALRSTQRQFAELRRLTHACSRAHARPHAERLPSLCTC